MQKIKSLKQYLSEESAGAASPAAPAVVSNEKIKQLSELISKFLTRHVDNLKRELLTGQYQKQGFFSSLNNWWNNLIYGSRNKKNPYYYQNVFGRLGVKESVIPTLAEYQYLEKQALILEQEVAAGTKLEKILDAWSKTFKVGLEEIIYGCIAKGNCELSDLSPQELEAKTVERLNTDKSVEDHGEEETPPVDTSTTTTTTTPVPLPIPPAEVLDIDLSKRNEVRKHKALIDNWFRPWMALDKRQQNRLNKEQNGDLFVDSPMAHEKIGYFDIQLPLMLLKKDPRYQTIQEHFPNYLQKMIAENRAQSPTETDEQAIMRGLIRYSDFNLQIAKNKNIYGSEVYNIIQRDPAIYEYIKSNIDRLKYFNSNLDDIENGKYDREMLQDFIDTLKNKKIDELLGLTESKKALKSLRDYNHISFDDTSTLYERTLVCLEKIRSRD